MLLFHYVMHEGKAGFITKIENAKLLDQLLSNLRHPAFDYRHDKPLDEQSIIQHNKSSKNGNAEVREWNND